MRIVLALGWIGCGSSDPTDTAPATTSATTDATVPEPPADFGPSNRWPHVKVNDIPSNLAGTGLTDGFVAYDFVLKDQYGDDVSLYQFYGRVVLLDFMSVDCTGCSTRTFGHQQFWEDIDGDDTVMVVVVLRPDATGAMPTVPLAETWSAQHFVTYPVLVDEADTLADWLPGGVPNAFLIDWDMRIIESVFEPVDTNVVMSLAGDAPGN